jgi:hypothetical protein
MMWQSLLQYLQIAQMFVSFHFVQPGCMTELWTGGSGWKVVVCMKTQFSACLIQCRWSLPSYFSEIWVLNIIILQHHNSNTW